MATRILAIIITMVLLAVLAGCGGSHGLTGVSADPAAGPQPAAGDAAQPAVAGGLPELSKLAGGQRSVSFAGPGYYPVDPVHTVASANTSLLGASQLHLSSGLTQAYAVYGVAGFDGDNFPTSLKVTVINVTGQYYVGFSDYVKGTWNIQGPFNGSAEVQIPNLSLYTSPTAYMSSAKVHYFTILADTGADFVISGLQQGVDGGARGPAAPASGRVAGGDAGVTVTWLPSLGQWDPDFAGYKLQRAPLLLGNYADSSPDVLTITDYFDGTAQAGTSYRWRIAAIDVNGNLSVWTPFLGGGDVGVNLPPIVKCSIPQGRLYGPRDVTFDFTGTVDPENDPITEYDILLGGSATPISSATPLITVTLQPGCYPIIAAAKAGSTGFIQLALKLYPQWASTPVVVREPDLNTTSAAAALGFMRLFVDAADQRAYTFAYDFTRQEYCVIIQGVEHTFPGYAFPVSSGEPFKSGGTIYYPVITSHTVLLLSWTPGAGSDGSGQLTQVYPNNVFVFNSLQADFVAAAPDANGHIWVFYARDDSGNLNLYAQQADGPSAPTELVHNILTISALDAVYNPGSGLIELAYSNPGGLQVSQFDPVAVSVGVWTILDLLGVKELDLELVPGINQPAAIYMESLPAAPYLYSERSGLVWSAAVQVDISATNERPVDMAIANGTAYALFALSDNQGRLYSLSTSGATVRNTPATFSTFGGEFSLQPGVGDTLVAAWRESSGKTIYSMLNSDGTDSDAGHWDATEGQGLMITGAATSDGLHAMWYSLLEAVAHHMVSADGGQTWSPQSDTPNIIWLTLGSNSLGDLYLSYYDDIGNKNRLRVWDPIGVTWVDQGQDSDSNNARVHPLLAASPLSKDITWIRYDTTATNIAVSMGNTGVFGASNFTSTLMPLWDGAAVPGDFSTQFYALTVGGGPTPDGGLVAHYEGAGEPKGLYASPGNAPNDLLTPELTAGNNFAAALYNNQNIAFLGGGPSVFYATHGQSLAPIRFQRGLDPESVQLPLPAAWNEFYQRDLRRTVSASTVGGGTAVAIFASLDGREHYMEWSNFGAFEQLDLPPLSDGIRPTIFAGQDGRWHLLYKDPETDRIMCLSTL